MNPALKTFNIQFLWKLELNVGDCSALIDFRLTSCERPERGTENGVREREVKLIL